MDKYLLILGRHPRLSLAELTKVAPDFEILSQDKNLVLGQGELEAEQLLDKLGGTIKIAKYLAEIDNLNNLTSLIKPGEDKEKKFIFGFSVYGRKKFPKELKKLAINYKKELKQQGYKVRYVESREPVLSSVIVQKEKCQEIILYYQGEKIIVGQTLAVQKFADYSKRDYGRPARDAYSGMLPPKLAKIMVNLAEPRSDDLILDPFCGSGTVLQEAWMLGYKNLRGSDLSDKAVQDSLTNLKWLAPENDWQVWVAPAEKISETFTEKADRIVCEVYLGPVKGEVKINKSKQELRKLYIKVLTEFKKILNPPAKLVIAFPAWKVENKVVSLELVDEFKKIGYQVNKDTYLYGRPDAQILREIYVLDYGKKE